MNAKFHLFSVKHPYTENTEELFFKAMQENVKFHYQHCPEYKTILDSKNFSPEYVTDENGLEKLPVLPTLLFKRHHLFSIPERKLPIKATSSGTKGSFSRIGLDWSSLFCGFLMVLHTAKWRKLLSFRPVNYIILGYQPNHNNQMAVMKTAFGATFFAPALHRVYALKYQNGTYQADLDSLLKQLIQFSKQKHPVRFMGFPSYTYFLLKIMQERNILCPLPKGSKIMFGGGWKQFYTEEVEKQALYALIKKNLNVDEENIIEFFGAVEHPILWCDCPAHHFHVPVYARAIIRDIHTLEPLPMGEKGLVNLLTPMIKAVPVSSIMTDDIGILHSGETCSCGLRVPYLEILGRTGIKDIKTCAAGASELLKGQNL